MTHHITLLGCGAMGGALLQGWLAGGIDASYHVIKPRALPEKFLVHSISCSTLPDVAVLQSDVVVLAVKPQIMAQALTALQPFVAPDALVISIAAGWRLQKFQSFFPASQPVIRTLPNLPAEIGKGMTLAVSNDRVQPSHTALTQRLFDCVGLLEWLEDEALMNAASMISGAGPAFPFYLVEMLAKAGERNGVPLALSMRLARQTIIGAGALLEARSDKSADAFRESVTSPGGVTEAALKILMNGEMQKLFDDALKAGTQRGEELNG